MPWLHPYIVNVAPDRWRKLLMPDDTAYRHANPLCSLPLMSYQHSGLGIGYEVAVEICQCRHSLRTECHEVGIGSGKVSLQREPHARQVLSISLSCDTHLICKLKIGLSH
jgi:hypothetical protein